MPEGMRGAKPQPVHQSQPKAEEFDEPKPFVPEAPVAESAMNMEEDQPSKKSWWPFSKKAMMAAVAVIAVLGVASSIMLFNKYRVAQANIKKLSDPNAVAKLETTDLTAKVGKLIELPHGEDPTLATVVDVSKLKDQQFFANAQNGDKVLMYTAAKKAILYRPSTNKIIEVAPINVGNSAASTPAPAAKKP